MFVLPNGFFEAKGSSMKHLNTIFLAALLSLVVVGCGGVDEETRAAAAAIDQMQSNIKDSDVKPESSNLCQGPTDKKQMFRENSKFANNMDDCVELGFFDADLNTQCLNGRYPEMTTGCIDCFAKLTKCAVNSCMGPCMADKTGEDCEKCQKGKCHKEMYKCSGVVSTDIPSLRKK